MADQVIWCPACLLFHPHVTQEKFDALIAAEGKLDQQANDLQASRKALNAISGAVGNPALEFGDVSLEEALAAFVVARLNEQGSRLDSAETLCSQMYQVLGCLTDDFNIFAHPLVQRALTALEQRKAPDDLLPWPSKTPHEWKRESDAAEASVVERHDPFAGHASNCRIRPGVVAGYPTRCDCGFRTPAIRPSSE